MIYNSNFRGKISVIIPIYNAEKYLAECLKSVVEQTFTDFEIICINDGSSDGSLRILQDFRKKDERIKIIDQKNAGVSAARNAGLKLATCKYIGFVDSDDTLEKNFFETLFVAAQENNADIVFSRELSSSDTLSPEKIYSRSDIRSEILPLYFKQDNYNPIWNKLYAASIIKENNILFPVDRTHGEDGEFNIKFLYHSECLKVIAYSGYHYRETPGSATRNVAGFNFLQHAVDTYHKDWSELTADFIPPAVMKHLKKERFINNILSQIYICVNPENLLSFRERWKRLSKIVQHPLVGEVFAERNAELQTGFSRYQKELYKGIKKKSVITLYLLSMYSYYRNRK